MDAIVKMIVMDQDGVVRNEQHILYEKHISEIFKMIEDYCDGYDIQSIEVLNYSK